jgi:cytochrome c oxidase assembly protein subunit 15
MSKPRAIFEDVSGARAAPGARPGVAERARQRNRRVVAFWLFALAALVCAMVLVGGMTRLTDSGLSMVSWHPVMGAVPPLTDADWQAEFAKYQQTEQFRTQNSWMALADFRSIYWWEWGHRQFGRVIGLVWALGFVIFAALRMIPRGYAPALAVPGLLGGLQALVGMWMVESGVAAGSTLVSVAPYRLTLHLGLAFGILAALLWPAWRLLRADWVLLQARRRRPRGAMALAGVTVAATFIQILLGALVAGNDAGRGYIDWPLMNGAILPPEAFDLSPAWRNLVEGAALVQFDHRVGGYALALLAAALVVATRRTGLTALGRWALFAALAVWAQMAWGIVTVMHGAPLALAIVHQAGALLTFGLVLRARFEAAYPAEQSVRG